MPAGYVPYTGGPSTPQKASWGKRVLTTILRGLVLLPLNLLAQAVAAGSDALGVLMIIVVLVVGITYTVRSYIQRGHLGYDWADAQTGVAIVRESTGAPMGSGMSVFGRSFAHLLDAIPCYLGFLWPLWDKKGQTFADKVCSTIAVQSGTRHRPMELLVNSLKAWEPVIKA
jgi:hypothetical protein